MLLVFEWLWVIVIALPPLIGSDLFQTFISSPAPAEQIQPAPADPSPLTWIFVGVVTIAVLAMTIIVLIRLPKVILTAGDKTVQATSKSVLPIVTHHQPISAKRRRSLTLRLNLAVQLVLVIVPIVLSPFLPPFDQLGTIVIISSTLILAVMSALLFVLGWVTYPRRDTTSRTRSRASRG